MDLDRVPLQIGGKGYFLHYPLGILAKLQGRLGCKTFDELLQRIDALQPGDAPEGEDPRAYLLRVDLEDLQVVLWYGMLHAGIDKDFDSPDALGMVISGRDLATCLVAIAGAIAVQFARPDEAPDNPDPPPQGAPTPSQPTV